MDLYPLLLDAMLAPHTLVRSQSKLATPVLEETSAGWLVTAALPGLSAKEVSVETSVDADGDAHLWLHAQQRLKTELRCVPRGGRAAAAMRRDARARQLGASALCAARAQAAAAALCARAWC